jgi:hypothetical protein
MAVPRLSTSIRSLVDPFIPRIAPRSSELQRRLHRHRPDDDHEHNQLDAAQNEEAADVGRHLPVLRPSFIHEGPCAPRQAPDDERAVDDRVEETGNPDSDP